MTMLSIRRRPRTLYIIAPSLYQCHHTAMEWGLNPPAIENFRNITRAQQLRGAVPGTPFIAMGRDSWAATEDGFLLDRMLTHCQQKGILRIAQQDDLADHRMYDGVPMRSETGQDARAAI